MSRSLIPAGICLSALAFGGCDIEPSDVQRPEPQARPQQRSPTPLVGDVSLTIDVSILPDKRVQVRGTTNLPAGTILLVSIERRFDTPAQTKCKVASGGTFQTVPLGPAGGYPNGIYVADVVMPVARLHSPEVQKVIGREGEHLRGPLVTRDSLGVSVHSSTEFSIGGTNAAADQRNRVLANLKLDQQLLGKINLLARRLKAARPLMVDPNNLENLDNQRRWGEFARQFNADWKALASQIDNTQDFELRLMLGEATGHLMDMFLDVAFDQPAEYRVSKKKFDDSVVEVRNLIADRRASIDNQ